MKKMLALCFMAACLLLGGCQNPGRQERPGNPNPTEAVPMPGLDAQSKFMQLGNNNFSETDEFFCGTAHMGEYAFYYDKTSGLSGALCADPACAHDAQNCGAYVGDHSSVTCYDGKRYWVAQNGQSFTLCRSDLAGTNQERLKTLDWNEIILTYQPQWFAIHRGRLYIYGRAQTVEGTEAGLRMTLLSMSLDESQEVAVLYDKTFGMGTWPTVRFVGDNVYYSVVTRETELFDLSIQKIDIKDGSMETVYEETGISEIPGDIWVTNQGEIYLPGDDADRAYVWKLENGKRKEILCWEGLEVSTVGVADGIAFVTSVKDELRWIDIVDLSGKAIYSGRVFTEELPEVEGDPNNYRNFGFALMGGDTEKIILNLFPSPENDHEDANFTIQLDLRNNLKPTVLWSSEG